jgi:heptosyltransferase-2
VYKTLVVDGKQFRVKHFEPIRHQVYRHLDLVGHLGGNRASCPPRIWLGSDATALLDKFLGHDPRPVIGLNAGAEYGPAKRWFPDRFAAVARRVSDKIASRWLLLGGPCDVEIAGTIEATLRTQATDQSSIINVAGKTTLLELCALLQSCKVLLTNDTGSMHLAGALDVPQVAIFGSTSPELTGPLSDRATVIRHPVECSPCFRRECPIDFRCMTQVTVDEVANTVAAKLLRVDKS